mgnify:CR=1 FL=1
MGAGSQGGRDMGLINCVQKARIEARFLGQAWVQSMRCGFLMGLSCEDRLSAVISRREWGLHILDEYIDCTQRRS